MASTDSQPNVVTVSTVENHRELAAAWFGALIAFDERRSDDVEILFSVFSRSDLLRHGLVLGAWARERVGADNAVTLPAHQAHMFRLLDLVDSRNSQALETEVETLVSRPESIDDLLAVVATLVEQFALARAEASANQWLRGAALTLCEADDMFADDEEC